jgi:nicotinamide-nucleotide amidase
MNVFPDDVLRQAESLLASCRGRQLKIATAESCTGGLIIGALTEIAGSSDVVDRGFVTYSNEAKQAMLGVRPDILAKAGAVSKETGLAMVTGALANSAADIAVAVTGIAGPGGGTAAKPVGLVHLAAANRQTVIHQELQLGDIGRSAIRMETVRAALEMLSKVAAQSLK